MAQSSDADEVEELDEISIEDMAEESPPRRAAGPQGWAAEEEGEDLNKVSEEELALRKQQMSEVFEKNRLRPGDAGYVHDRRVDFSGDKEANDWDDDIESVESEIDEIDALLKGL